MDAISRRYRKPKGRPSKEGVCVHPNDEGPHAGEKEQYLNASASKFQMFPSTSTSTFCPRHAALELFSMTIGIHAMDKKTFSKCLHKLYEEKCSFKEDNLEISRKVARKHHEDLLGTANDVIDITVSYDGT
ncbi:uncharacterized protein TNCV_2933431 [Trichonephila clavipes]|nr:uncharacterized protein TNCV_2933431 [Trichonephila clavipes]